MDVACWDQTAAVFCPPTDAEMIHFQSKALLIRLLPRSHLGVVLLTNVALSTRR